MKCTGKRCPMQHPFDTEKCEQTDCMYRTEPMTNGDLVRSLDNEQMALFLTGKYIEALEKEAGDFPQAIKEACTLAAYELWKEWVNKEIQ